MPCRGILFIALVKQTDRMKRIIVAGVLFTAMAFAACGDHNDRNDAELKDPAVVQPPSEAIPDSTRIVADSVIVPDTVPNNGRR